MYVGIYISNICTVIGNFHSKSNNAEKTKQVNDRDPNRAREALLNLLNTEIRSAMTNQLTYLHT